MTTTASPLNPTALFLRGSQNAGHVSGTLVIPEWDEAAWEDLFSYMQPVHVREGETLIQRGGVERSLYFVTSGALEVSSTINDMGLGPIASVQSGSVVGEVAFFDADPRSAKVWAIADSDLMRLDYEDYKRYLNAHPVRAAALLFSLGRLIAIRLRRLNGQISQHA